MAVFTTIKEPVEINKALAANGLEAIVVDGKLLGFRAGPLRIAPTKGGELFVSKQEDYGAFAQKEAP